MAQLLAATADGNDEVVDGGDEVVSRGSGGRNPRRLVSRKQAGDDERADQVKRLPHRRKPLAEPGVKPWPQTKHQQT